MTNVAAIHSKTPIERILIIKLRHHGDMLLTTPVIDTLKKQYPDAEVDMLIYLETRDMLVNNSQLHQLFTIDRDWKKQGVFNHLSQEALLIKRVIDRHYNLVINLADQWRSALVTRLTGAPIRLGFNFPKRKGILWRQCHTQLVSIADHNTLHTVEQNLSILAPLNLTSLIHDVTMGYSTEDALIIAQLLQENNINHQYIVVQPTSRWFFKCWSEEKMAETIGTLTKSGYSLIITAGPDPKELEMVDNILNLCSGDKVTSLAGRLSLPQLAALIDRASLFIGVDSVAMHMAAALKTPLIALFGPSKLTFWKPWQASESVIWAGDFGSLPDPDDVDTHTSERYLNAIPTQVVIDKAKRLLS